MACGAHAPVAVAYQRGHRTVSPVRMHRTKEPKSPGRALAVTHIFPAQLASIPLPSTCPVGAASRPCSPFAAYMLRQSIRQSFGLFRCPPLFVPPHRCYFEVVMVRDGFFGVQIKSECFSLRMLATPPTRFKPMTDLISEFQMISLYECSPLSGLEHKTHVP
jgi:hypothetical protein